MNKHYFRLASTVLLVVITYIVLLAIPTNAEYTTCDGCHSDYANTIRAKMHDKTDNCLICHKGEYDKSTHTVNGYIGYKVTEETCNQPQCHSTTSGIAKRPVYESHGNKYYGPNKADCTQCHFANTTRKFTGYNSTLYTHDHNFTVEYNFYNYNRSGIPLASNVGKGIGMFPYYTCTLTCHGTGQYSVENEVTSWSESAHARSRHGNETYDSKNSCAKCKSPPNYNVSASSSAPIAEANWQGIQCRVCHNLHNDTYSGASRPAFPLAFYNSTASSLAGSPVYDKVASSTELCENCHTGTTHNSKFGGTHKDVAGFNCASCHANSTFNDATHKFEVRNTTSGVTGCEVCHKAEDHKWQFTSSHAGKVECVACHDQTVGRNASGYAVSSDKNYGIYKDTSTNRWTTYKLSHGTAATWPLHNITADVSCTKCHGSTSVFSGPIVTALTCSDCHASYSSAVSSTGHNKTRNANAPGCTDCHAGYEPTYKHTSGNRGFIVNESNTCRNCHGLEESHGKFHPPGADCTQCHFANNTKPFSLNTSLYTHDHSLKLEYNFYNYNLSGIPLSGNGGAGAGMFPYYTCTLTCHGTGKYSVEDEVTSWYASAHARSRHGNETYDSKNSCAKCKSPPNYNVSTPANAPIAAANWQGIQCRVCHNLHNNTYSGTFGMAGFPLAFYNSTASSVAGSSVYDKVASSTELCEKCHTGSSHDSKFAGTHKDTAGLTCADCHANSKFSNATHKFEVRNTTSGVTGCEVCHKAEDHTWRFTSLHTGKVECVACHDQTVGRNGSGYAVSSDNKYGIYKDTTTSDWTTYKLSHGAAATWPLHNISKTISCSKCHGTTSVFSGAIAPAIPTGTPGYYVGDSSGCGVCHPKEYAYWRNTTHTSKLVPRDDAIARGYPNPPGGYGWDNVSYVIGSKWKLRYVNDTGYMITTGGNNQYNVAEQKWVDYEKNKTKGYDCGHCHTTGYISNVSDETKEPWKTMRAQGQYPAGVYDNSLAPGFTGYWAENSVGCEACHGPGGDHVNNPGKSNIINASEVLSKPEICGDCHSRQSGEHLLKPGEVNLVATLTDSSPSPLNGTTSGQHHEQWEDWSDSTHRTAGIGCATCHNGHNTSNTSYAGGPTGRTRFVNGAVYPAAVQKNCLDCHGTNGSKHRYTTVSACLACHMPEVRQSATIFDTRSHWFDFRSLKANKKGEPHGINFDNLKNITRPDGVKNSCEKCHGRNTDPNVNYGAVYRASAHNNSAKAFAPYCTDCHKTGYINEVVNETTTCRNAGCHAGQEESHGNKYYGPNKADCTQCHFANTTKTLYVNNSLYINSHELTVEYNFYNYNLSGIPLSTNGGAGKGMFPYYTCSLTCHKGKYTIEEEVTSWYESAHARSRHGDATYDSKNSCAKCKSPPNYNVSASANAPIAAADWQGIQCRVCHNLHNDTYSGKDQPAFPLAFYNSTASSLAGSPVYDKVASSTELCEKCHTGTTHNSKFAGTHKDTARFTCASCHANKTLNSETHKFSVENTATGKTGCESCHAYPGTAHNYISGYHVNVTCWACHDNTVSLNSTGFAVSTDNNYGIYKDTSTGKWTTYKVSHGSAASWPLHNIERNITCSKCHGAKSVYSGMIAIGFGPNVTYTTDKLKSGYNLITVPLAPEPALTAKDLLAVSKGGIPGVSKVMMWNVTAQQWDSYIYADNVYIGMNFNIEKYRAYFILGNSSTANATFTFVGRH